METVFWTSIFLIGYTYMLYPLGIALIARVLRAGSRRDSGRNESQAPPAVSIILCARNEIDNITERLENLCRENYDPSLLEIVVVSDGSTDGTNEAIKAFRERLQEKAGGPQITLIIKNRSEGKAAGLNDAVAKCDGEILVMTDARQRFGKNDSDTETVRHLVDALSDPAIGCVSGELRFIDEESSALQTELGAYWRYEKWIRRNEASVDSIPGVAGAIYAMRKHLYEPIPAGTLLDDVLIPLQVVLRGSRVVYEDQSIARDHASVDAKQEWRRKVRTLAGNWQLINLIPQAFIPLRNRIWIQFISHKFLRLIVPFALILALVSCAIIPSRGYRIIFYTQIAFYLCAVVPAWRKVRIFSIAHTFVLLNLAAIAGLWAWITGQAHKTWVRNSENEV